MNIVLIGYRCTGKTSAGGIIAREMGKDFLDTDVLIAEKVGSSIKEFVSDLGWDRFREVERQIIREISEKDNLIIATGGGVVMDEDNVRDLKRRGRIFWLDAGADVIRKRMEKEQKRGNIRPSLTGKDPIDEIEHLLNVRRPLYRQASDVVVDSNTFSPQDVADLILRACGNRIR